MFSMGAILCIIGLVICPVCIRCITVALGSFTIPAGTLKPALRNISEGFERNYGERYYQIREWKEAAQKRAAEEEEARRQNGQAPDARF